MIRTIITIITILLSSVFVFGQNNAKDILDKSAAKIKSYPAVEIDFTLTMENKEENINETHTGKAFMKGNFYKLEIMDVINYYDGKNIYTYMPEVEEVNIKDPSDEDEEMLNPTTMFDIHNSDFNQKLVSNSGNVAYIELTPKSNDKNFSKIGVWVNTSNNIIQKVTSFGKDGNNLIIDIKNIKEPASPLADSFFKFNPAEHPGVEVIDLR